MRRLVTVLATATLIAATAATVVNAQDDDCEASLLAAPVEDMPLADGWSLLDLTPAPDGWSGLVARDDATDFGQVSFSVSCTPLGAEISARRLELKTSRFGAEALEIAPFGTFSAAYRYDPYALYLDDSTEGPVLSEADAFLWLEADWGTDELYVMASTEGRRIEDVETVFTALREVLPGESEE